MPSQGWTTPMTISASTFLVKFNQDSCHWRPAGNPLKHDRFQLTSSERFCPLPFLMAILAYKRGKTCGHRAALVCLGHSGHVRFTSGLTRHPTKDIFGDGRHVSKVP